MSAQVAADLRAAADVLERDGWAQGGLASCGRCAIEAVWQVTGSIGQRPQDAVETLRAVIPAPSSIILWNDKPGRTADEVITALRAAADRAESQP